MENCLSVDWLQLHVLLPVRLLETKDCGDYYVEREQTQTRNFKAILNIFTKKDKRLVAVLAAEPRNTMCMNERSGLLKILNDHLYRCDLLEFVNDLLCQVGLTFVNITRLDIAMDFLKFDTMQVADFIEKFAANEILKKRSCDFKLMGQTKSVHEGQLTGGYNSLKFGKESSDISYYLYNKTLELEQVKHKPYIHDHWRSMGWDSKQKVYRLEFSLRPDTRGIVLDTGEVLTFKDLGMINRIDDLYKHYFNNYFNFVHAEKTKKGNYRKQSRCKPVLLFEQLKAYSVTIKLSDKRDSGRSTKIFAKQLKQLNDELRGIDHDLAIVGNTIFTYVVASRNLQTWANKKLNIDETYFNEQVLLAMQKRNLQELYTSLMSSGDDVHKLGKLQQQTLKFVG